MTRHETVLTKGTTGLLVIDIQERINAVMKYRERVVKNTAKLISGLKILNVPIFVTEQYRKGLGPTEKPILDLINQSTIVEKMTYSCCMAQPLMEQLRTHQIKQVAVCGIETHVCVLQTCLDLLAHGFQVHLVTDAISSRRKLDHEAAIDRMVQAGVIPTTTEAVLFELLEQAGTPEFKQISKLVK
ncbi:MAG: hydrolase [candidate division KSB1 bacterium]|nr:hydrolase [candidate division KSB1 bacterium]MDZ7356040.1 hydrolase [candidate division KSB1 bacterium]MDZ7376550.1 hydrolase [candidate division KSB1 bacterium]MDZ7400557.1 hydrolase [candidate division KSB1 bacterium]